MRELRQHVGHCWLVATTVGLSVNARGWLGRTSHDGISRFIFWFSFNKTDLLFYWIMGYECISTKLIRIFIEIWAPIGTDK
jgi:hypothetical protein